MTIMQLHYELNDLKDIDIMTFLPIILPVIAVGALLVFIAFIDLYRHRKTRKMYLYGRSLFFSLMYWDLFSTSL